MKLALAILPGGRREALIGDAVLSAQDWCDVIVLLRTHDSDAAIEVVKRVATKPVIVQLCSPALNEKWNAGVARNEVLDAAEWAGCDWAFTLDTDQRALTRGEDVRRVLEEALPEVTHVAAWDKTEESAQVRAFRLPRQGAFTPVAAHEEWLPDDNRGLFPLLRYWEVEKTPEQQTAVDWAVATDCRERIAAKREPPSMARTHFYLGDALWSLGAGQYRPRDEELITQAIEAMDISAGLEERLEIKAYTLVRAGLACAMVKRYEDGLERCTKAMAVFPAMPEAPFYAARVDAARGNLVCAIWWCRMAISLGKLQGWGTQATRGWFQDARAQWEGPYELLGVVLDKLKRPAEAAEARSLAQAAQLMRLKQEG